MITSEKRGRMKKVSLIALLILMLLPTGVRAHESVGHQALSFFNPEEEKLRDVSAFVQDLATIYSHELARGADTVGLKFQTRLEDDLRLDDLSLIEGQQDQARKVAQRAFRSVIRHTMEQVDFIQTLKTYGEQMSFTQFRMTADTIQVSGPSLNGSLNDGEMGRLPKSQVLSVRSGMSLTDTIHIAPMIQAHLGELNSKVIYDPLAGGDWRFSLGQSITSHSSVEMVYLLKSTDDQNLLATFRFGF